MPIRSIAANTQPLQRGDRERERDQQQPDAEDEARNAPRTSAQRPRGSGPRCGGERAAAARWESTWRGRRRSTTRPRIAREWRAAAAPGSAAAGRAPSSPFATPLQKRSVAPVPNDASGRDRVAPVAPVLRPRRSARSTASSCSGPVGPLKNAFWSSPQRPSNAIHGYAAAGRGGIARDRLHGRACCRRVGRACCRSRPLLRRSCRGTARRRTCSRGSRPPDRRPGACRRRARASRRPRRRARRPRASCTRPRRAPPRAPRAASAASKTSWIISQSPSWVLLKSLKG